jgi:hypothetical protein
MPIVSVTNRDNSRVSESGIGSLSAEILPACRHARLRRRLGCRAVKGIPADLALSL